MDWLQTTLQTYPEIAVLLSLAVGYWIGVKKFRGFSLGAVTGTLLAAIVIGQLGITVSGPLKSLFFLLFLFAVGYGIGPQFVRGLAQDGLPQAAFAVVMCLLCLGFPAAIVKIAGYDLGSAAGLFAGSQTISASMGLANDAINRTGLPPDQISKMLAGMPVAYAVTYLFGTIGSAFLLAQILPPLMGVNLKEACRDYESKNKIDSAAAPIDGTAWHEYELRAYKIGKCTAGLTIAQLEHGFPKSQIFVEGLERDGQIMDISSGTVLKPGDILAIGGDHQAIVDISKAQPGQCAADTSAANGNRRPEERPGSVLPPEENAFEEVENQVLVNQPVSGLSVFVSRKEVNCKSLAELAAWADAHGVFVRSIKRGLTGVEIPILATTKLHRGDVLTLFGLDKNVRRAARDLGVIDERTDSTDVAFMSAAIVIGALVGAIVVKAGGVPLTLSTAGGALIAGLIFGWLRSVHPTFGYIPSPTIWFMNSVGLNVFIAVVGLSAGPNFVNGLRELGLSLFVWGMVATALPLIVGAFIGRYIFKFHPAVLYGCCAGARTTTAALGMINEKAESTIPSLGYTITYAVGNTLLTLWGLVLILILS